MAELGLFVPENPVTYQDPLTAYMAAHAHPTEGTCDFPGAVLVTADTREVLQARGVQPYTLDHVAYELPASERGKGLITAQQWFSRHKSANPNKATAVMFCNLAFWPVNPWVDEARGAVLFKMPEGQYFYGQHPCLVGYDTDPWARWDLDGTLICDLYQTIRLQDSTLQDLYAQPPDPLSQFGNSGSRALDLVRRGPPASLSIAGVNVGDVLKVVDALTGGQTGNTDVTGVIQALVALVVQGGNIGNALKDIPGQLGGTVLGLADVLGQVAPDLSRRLSAALDQQTQGARASARDQVGGTAAALSAGAPSFFSALVDASGSLLAKLADIYKDAVDALIGSILRVFRDDIESHAPVTAGNVDKVAAAALRGALTAGSIAQLAGMGLELLHPLKQLGVQQAIGVLAEFAGFSEIARPFFGATLRYGIGLPAEHRAAAHFRSVLPPLAEVREAAAAGVLDLEKYYDRLVLAGYPDPFPAVFRDLAYTPPPARMLANMLDGSESDTPWLARKLRRLGFSPEDTERATAALELKTTQPGRSRVVSVLLDQYQHGRLERDDLAAGLAGAGLSPAHRDYYLRAGDLDRRGYRMELVATEALNQYRNDLAGASTVRQLLVGLGFSADEVTVRLTAADLRRNVKQLADEDKAIETEIRTLKAAGLSNATRQLRAGFLELSEFLAIGQGMGYSLAYLQTAAQTALLQGPTSTTGAEAAIGLGALDEARRRVAQLVAQEVTNRRQDRLAALASLRTLGLPDDLVTTLVGLAEAIAGPRALAGEYGMPAGGKVGGAFGAIEELVLGGLGSIKNPADVVAQLLGRLGLPARDRVALVRLIKDVRDLFQ